jgi:hypothetical protein
MRHSSGLFSRGFCISVAIALSTMSTAEAKAEEWRFPSDQITLEQWTEFRNEVLAKPDLDRKEFGNQLILTSSAEYRAWVFTEPGHPAHPAVIIRIIESTPSGGSTIRRQGHFGGDRAAFDTWWHQFDELDARVVGHKPQ